MADSQRPVNGEAEVAPDIEREARRLTRLRLVSVTYQQDDEGDDFEPEPKDAA